MERPQAYRAGQPGKVVADHGGRRPLNASIRSGAGFGTLVMAVVMLIRTFSPCRDFHRPGITRTPLVPGRLPVATFAAT